jgi:GH15 family glucan-1,4-alpha-glucosidase
METPRYPSLGEYGVIGNLETCCLVSRYGSIDWCCLPHVESPSVFGALLDADRGGRFQIQPVYPYQSSQTYVERTNVLTTEFFTPTGRGRLVDWMPFPGPDSENPTPNVVYRKVGCSAGPMRFAVTFEPRFDYAREVPEVHATEHGVVARGEQGELSLSAPVGFAVDDGAATAVLTLTAGDTVWLAMAYDTDCPYDPVAYQQRLEATMNTWQQWLRHGGARSREIDDGRWAHLLDRSALVLKLLIHRETGAIAAAPTTSLPECIGGTRNWDYRYSWIRDAALTVQALSKLGYSAEAKAYFSWLLSKVYEDPSSIRPLYGLHGRRPTAERSLDHLEGYRGSAPVRVGNAAEHQRQHDVYGELVLALYETSRYGEALTASDWTALRDIVDYVEQVWDEPDAGIWEIRAEPRHFVHSKVMCWTALDRGIRIVEETSFEGPVARWRRTRSAIREAVLARGYDEGMGSFVQTFGTDDALDATGLLIPIFEFLPIDDPRVQGTIDAVRRHLTTDEGLVYRYDVDDGLPGGEGAFVLCSFWLVDALALSGRLDEAEALFDSILSHASALGLFSEEIAAESGALLGNFPQAFSHIGLVNSVLYLDEARTDHQTGPEPLGTGAGTDQDTPTADRP